MNRCPLTLVGAGAALLFACPAPLKDVHLAAPTSGFQLKIDPFDVPQGVETQRCYFFAIPGDQPVYVNRFEIAQNPGTHHMNVFRVKTQLGLKGQPGEVVEEGECWKSGNWADWPLVVNSQESEPGNPNPGAPGSDGYTAWTLPATTAMRFEPGELIMLQTHYVNATTQKTPLQAKVFVNFHTVEAGSVAAEVGTAFTTNQHIRVCPGQEKFFEATCKLAPTDRGVTIIAANSHFHSRGTKFDISVLDPANPGGTAPFYTSTEWADPPMEWGLDVKIPAGGGVRYRCEYSVPSTACGDPNDSCCFNFGGKVESQEHCNAFIYYYPKLRDVGCF